MGKLKPRLKIRNVHPWWRNVVTFHSMRPFVWALTGGIVAGLFIWWREPGDQVGILIAAMGALIGHGWVGQGDGHAATMDMPREWRPQVEQLLRDSAFNHDRAHDRWVPHDPDWRMREIVLRDEGPMLRVSSSRGMLDDIRLVLGIHAKDGVPAVPGKPHRKSRVGSQPIRS